MGYIFDDWKALLDSFQQSVEKDLEEIHQQKAEVQQIKTDIFNKVESGLFYHDQKRIVISAPEIIIGNVDKSGTLQGGMGKVIIKGSEVGLEGVGETGQIINRAPSIRQLAVDPGIDGLENVVCETSQVISQACEITLHSSDAKDAFSQVPVSAGKGGVSIHADKSLNFEAAVSAEERKAQIEAVVKELKAQGDDLKKQVAAQKKNVDDCFKKMSELLDEENKLNKDDAFLGRVSVRDISEIHEEMEDIMPALYQSTQSFIHLVAQLAEVNRKKKALETEKDEIKTGDDFKKNTTGASMKIKAESISMETVDGDGNLHTNAEAGISVRTPKFGMSMKDDQGTLVENGGLAVFAQNIELDTTNPSKDRKEQPVVGKVNIKAKDINLEAIDYKLGDKKSLVEKELTSDSKITMTAKTIEVATTNPKDIERDDKGQITKGEYTAEGDVIFKSKNFTVESLDYEVKDGKLATKALTKDGSVSVRAEKTNFLAADAEGKSAGSFSVNAKTVDVKSMNVDKEKLTDDKLAEGSTMTLVSEKMYVGAKSKDVKSKKFQAVSEEMGMFADKTFEAQQGDGKAVVQLDGGNAAVGGSKTDIFGPTTINDKAEVKGEVKAPKVSADSVEAKSALKSPNISDGMAAGAGGGGGSLSAKLKTEDAPKSE
jgi:hypothetical protein